MTWCWCAHAVLRMLYCTLRLAAHAAMRSVRIRVLRWLLCYHQTLVTACVLQCARHACCRSLRPLHAVCNCLAAAVRIVGMLYRALQARLYGVPMVQYPLLVLPNALVVLIASNMSARELLPCLFDGATGRVYCYLACNPQS